MEAIETFDVGEATTEGGGMTIEVTPDERDLIVRALRVFAHHQGELAAKINAPEHRPRYGLPKKLADKIESA